LYILLVSGRHVSIIAGMTLPAAVSAVIVQIIDLVLYPTKALSMTV